MYAVQHFPHSHEHLRIAAQKYSILAANSFKNSFMDHKTVHKFHTLNAKKVSLRLSQILMERRYAPLGHEL